MFFNSFFRCCYCFFIIFLCVFPVIQFHGILMCSWLHIIDFSDFYFILHFLSSVLFFHFHFIISYIHLLLPFHSVEINGTTLSYILYRECILLRLFGRDYAGDTVVLGLQYIEKIQQQHTKKMYMWNAGARVSTWNIGILKRYDVEVYFQDRWWWWQLIWYFFFICDNFINCMIMKVWSCLCGEAENNDTLYNSWKQLKSIFITHFYFILIIIVQIYN